MKTNSKKIFATFVLFIISVTLFAQKDVTTFLGIPVDGYKSEMINKLKDKGFTINPDNKDILEGEFNGTKVNIFIVTNNNKVWRIAVSDAITLKEIDIRTRFNNLLQQFKNNKKYVPQTDSIIAKRTISETEDISYELLVNKKPYQAIFYQLTAEYESITKEINAIKEKQSLSDENIQQLGTLLRRQMEELYKCFNKSVWINLETLSGKYYITIFYDNEYNKANGEDL